MITPVPAGVCLCHHQPQASVFPYLRGPITPVIPLRAPVGMQTTNVTDETCIIVDSVQDMLDIDGQHITDTPHFGASVNTDFILGMGKVDESVNIRLDIDRLLAARAPGL